MLLLFAFRLRYTVHYSPPPPPPLLPHTSTESVSISFFFKLSVSFDRSSKYYFSFWRLIRLLCSSFFLLFTHLLHGRSFVSEFSASLLACECMNTICSLNSFSWWEVSVLAAQRNAELTTLYDVCVCVSVLFSRFFPLFGMFMFLFRVCMLLFTLHSTINI